MWTWGTDLHWTGWTGAQRLWLHLRTRRSRMASGASESMAAAGAADSSIAMLRKFLSSANTLQHLHFIFMYWEKQQPDPDAEGLPSARIGIPEHELRQVQGRSVEVAVIR